MCCLLPALASAEAANDRGCMENRKNPAKPVSGPNISIMVCCVNVVFTSVFEGRLRLSSINRFYLDCFTSGRGTVENLSFLFSSLKYPIKRKRFSLKVTINATCSNSRTHRDGFLEG